RLGSEAELIVGNEVQRAASGIPPQAGKIQGLSDDALARERGVAVDEHRQRGLLVLERWTATMPIVGGGACHALDNGVDELQVARIRSQDDVDRPTVGAIPPVAAVIGTRRAGVVLDVAGPALVGAPRSRPARARLPALGS